MPLRRFFSRRTAVSASAHLHHGLLRFSFKARVWPSQTSRLHGSVSDENQDVPKASGSRCRSTLSSTSWQLLCRFSIWAPCRSCRSSCSATGPTFSITSVGDTSSSVLRSGFRSPDPSAHMPFLDLYSSRRLGPESLGVGLSVPLPLLSQVTRSVCGSASTSRSLYRGCACRSLRRTCQFVLQVLVLRLVSSCLLAPRYAQIVAWHRAHCFFLKFVS